MKAPKLLNNITEYSNEYFSVDKKFIELYKDDLSLIKKYYTVTAKDFVVVIVQNEDMILCTKQFRLAANKESQEFIGGFIDEGESSEEAAKRETLEESGYKLNKLYLLGKISPMISKCTNTGYVYFSDDFSFEGKQLEEFEQYVGLTSTWAKIRDIRKNILNGDIADATTLAAWTLYRETIRYA